MYGELSVAPSTELVPIVCFGDSSTFDSVHIWLDARSSDPNQTTGHSQTWSWVGPRFLQ